MRTLILETQTLSLVTRTLTCGKDSLQTDSSKPRWTQGSSSYLEREKNAQAEQSYNPACHCRDGGNGQHSAGCATTSFGGARQRRARSYACGAATDKTEAKYPAQTHSQQPPRHLALAGCDPYAPQWQKGSSGAADQESAAPAAYFEAVGGAQEACQA